LSTIDGVEAHWAVDEVLGKLGADAAWINTVAAAEPHARADQVDPALPLTAVPFGDETPRAAGRSPQNRLGGNS
jgi:hypothetical protein